MRSGRSTEKEQMDNLELSGEDLNKTLSGLSTINKYLGNTSATVKAIKKEIIKQNPPLQIIDLGCGGGDNLRAIANWCERINQPIELLGIDGNEHILAHARQQNSPTTTIKYLQADILDEAFVLSSCDILISSHFMYHFSDDELVAFLRKSKRNISTKIIFSELQRNWFSYALFKLGAVFLPFSNIVKQDGLVALRRSFTKKELMAILERAELARFEVSWKWAFRLLVMVPMK
ncbi:MAG: 2-polyprenyl-3-methyl-5-hydroxy-6-metoxy-1,4-benzoquinol methylase [Flavobacteriales bacterium]|jgi:2-polyprenyl-3-methyl-5-hydroxy-6-metoxy-1,4-benzoquinol methylase